VFFRDGAVNRAIVWVPVQTNNLLSSAFQYRSRSPGGYVLQSSPTDRWRTDKLTFMLHVDACA
jgi:hypothetical protein